jgi:hypothetical protein
MKLNLKLKFILSPELEKQLSIYLIWDDLHSIENCCETNKFPSNGIEGNRNKTKIIFEFLSFWL